MANWVLATGYGVLLRPELLATRRTYALARDMRSLPEVDRLSGKSSDGGRVLMGTHEVIACGQTEQRRKKMETSERGVVQRHLAIVSALLLLLIGPIFGPLPAFLGERFGIETAVVLMLFAFLVGFGIILTSILRFREIWSDSLGESLRKLGWGQPSRGAAIIAAVVVGLAWGALFLSSTLQFDPDAALTELSLFRLAAILLAVLGAVLEDLITRGYVMNGLRQINVPSWGQLVLSALLFALYHTIWAFNVFSFIFSMVFGLILGGLFLWGKRSLTPVIVAHVLPLIIAEPFASMLIFIAPGA